MAEIEVYKSEFTAEEFELAIRATEDYREAYDTGYTDGFNSAPPDFLIGTETFRVPNLNVFGKKEIILNIPLVKRYDNMLSQKVTNDTVEHIIVNGKQDGTVTDIAYMFAMLTGVNPTDTTLKHITLMCDFSKATGYGRVFYDLEALEIVDGLPLDFSASTANNNVFGGCSTLKEFRVVPFSIKASLSIKSSPLLSPETIQSIIDGLADLTGQTAETLTLHNEVGNKLTEEQKATVTAKNWTLAY